MERIANIAGRAVYRRLLLGVIGTLGALAVYWLQVRLGLPRAFRLIAFLPLLAATYGFLQVREQTCVRLAAQGQRDLGRGVEAIEDPLERHRVRRQAMVVHASAVIGAAAVAAVLYVI